VQRRATKSVKELKNKPSSETLARARDDVCNSTVTYIVSGEKTIERRSDPGISYNKGIDKVDIVHFFQLDDGGRLFTWSQSQSKSSKKSASTATKILQPKSCLCMEQFTVFCCGGVASQHFLKKRLDDWSQDVDF